MNTPDFTRRDFGKGLSDATLGALADTVIVLWTGGGMAATETFDPTRYTPFEKGMNPNTVLSTFPSIPTAVDGIRFSEGLQKLAKVVNRGTLIRSCPQRHGGRPWIHPALAAPVPLAYQLPEGVAHPLPGQRTPPARVTGGEGV